MNPQLLVFTFYFVSINLLFCLVFFSCKVYSLQNTENPGKQHIASIATGMTELLAQRWAVHANIHTCKQNSAPRKRICKSLPTAS